MTVTIKSWPWERWWWYVLGEMEALLQVRGRGQYGLWNANACDDVEMLRLVMEDVHYLDEAGVYIGRLRRHYRLDLEAHAAIVIAWALCTFRTLIRL